MDFERSERLAARLAKLVPGGGHTYAKGADQYPSRSPGIIVRGVGSHVWDADGNEFIEYGSGLRSVALGHAYPAVDAAVAATLGSGTNFARPAAIELEAAERFVAIITGAEMVKFTKDGSTATTAAVRLARKATGRSLVAMCADHPFFSYDDWFISTTTMDGGVPVGEAQFVTRFDYNDLDGVTRLVADRGDELAAIVLEPMRAEDPAPGFLEGLRALCDRSGIVLVFDEMITGFRYWRRGAADALGVRADLATFGKALANGYSVSALCGRRELMELGDRRDGHDVFLLSTTHGAESPSLAAAIATMDVYESEPVIEQLARAGRRLHDGLDEVAAIHGVGNFVRPVGPPCNLAFSSLDADGAPSQAMRTLLLQELIARGVLGPSLVVGYSHSDADLDATLTAFDGALKVYAAALDGGVEKFLVGPPSRHVFDRR